MNSFRPGRANAPEAIITADIGGRIVFWSRGAERVFGYTQSEIVGQPLTALMPAKYRPAHEAGMERVRRERTSRLQGQTLRLEGLRKNGEVFPLELILATWFSSEQIYFTGIIRDLTETQEALQLYQDIYFDVTTILAESATFDEATTQLLHVLSDEMSWDAAAVWLAEGDVLRCHRFWHRPDVDVNDFERATEALALPRGVGLPGRVWADAHAAWVLDIPLDPNFPRASEALQAGLHSAMAFPILAGRVVVGVLEFFATTPRTPDDILLKLMTYVGSQIGLYLERERAEAALRLSERRYRDLFEKNVAGVFRTASDGRILEVNDAFARIFGYDSPEELMQMNSHDLYETPTDRARVLGLVRNASRVVEGRGLRKDGSPIWILLSLGADDDPTGGGAVLQGTVIDITSRKGAEERLARMTEMLNRAQTLASLGSFDENLITGIATWSDEMYRTTGLTPGSPVTLEVAKSLIVEEDRERVRAAVIQSVTGRRPLEITYQIQRADGERRHIRMHAEAEFDPSGKPLRLVGTAQDITEELRLLEERDRLRHQVEQVHRVSSLGQLAASMAHEFNNVLMGIQAHIEVMSRKVAGTPAVDRAVEHVLTSVRRGRRITEEILTFARPIAADLETVAVEDLLDHVRHLKLPGIRVEIAPPLSDLWILGDSAQLQQVLTNLAVNARDAMPGGGVLSVGVELSDELDGLPTVALVVSDTGVGITPEVQEHIFEPLFTTKRSSGTGLGLAITYQIVLAHSGRIAVTSTVGKGTTFRVSLQRVDAPAADTAPKPTPITSLPGVERVLLIEDDVTVSSGLSATLAPYGIEIQVLSRGAEAVQHVASFLPDAVVLDIGLPDMSGWDVLSELRKKFPTLPVVISSGHAVESDSIGAFPSAVIIRKPYATSDLLAALRGVVGD